MARVYPPIARPFAVASVWLGWICAGNPIVNEAGYGAALKTVMSVGVAGPPNAPHNLPGTPSCWSLLSSVAAYTK